MERQIAEASVSLIQGVPKGPGEETSALAIVRRHEILGLFREIRQFWSH